MITVNINGLSLCHKGSGGVSHNTLPDVCKTPGEGVPVPYENEAYSSDQVKGTVSVFADGGNMIANVGSQFARSVFDEPGSMGGIISGTNKAETDWISHSFDVFFEKKPACRLTDKLFMNHRNTVNMAGLWQKDLPEELTKKICDAICECKDKQSIATALVSRAMKGEQSSLLALIALSTQPGFFGAVFGSGTDSSGGSEDSEDDLHNTGKRQEFFAEQFIDEGIFWTGTTPKDPAVLVEVPYEIQSGDLIYSLTDRTTFPGGPTAPASKVRALNHAKTIGKGEVVIWDMIVVEDKYQRADLSNIKKILEIKFAGDSLTGNQKKAMNKNKNMASQISIIDEADCRCDSDEREEERERAWRNVRNFIDQLNKSAQKTFGVPGAPGGPAPIPLLP
ncbi:DUF4150 domain-containing protein [Enterobacter cloacae complex sp. 2024EL-00215]|uniref:DUF4150 domain-containing protein n=1 Tax=unclassified Enterobacter cloacae complex TaxID=2757714 RepID=UPI0037532650